MIDIGVNLADSSFDGDHEAVVARAQAAGVLGMIVTGTSVARSRRAQELVRELGGAAWCTAGVHPHDAKTCDGSTLDALRDLAAAPEVVAIGETGLDFFRDLSPRPVQEEWFAAQLELASELRMPVFVHDRDAAARCTAIVRAVRDRLPGGVVHCFTGSAEALRGYLDLDLHIGITGWICDERRGLELRDLVRQIPANRLLIETDAPYLIPRTLRPRPRTRRNEPMWLGAVRDAVAGCRGTTPQQVAAVTTANARELFRLGRTTDADDGTVP